MFGKTTSVYYNKLISTFVDVEVSIVLTVRVYYNGLISTFVDIVSYAFSNYWSIIIN